jgi:hypothetical protein
VRPAALSALFLAVAGAQAQNIAFEMRSHAESPVTFPNSSWTPWRAGADHRIFVNIQNSSPKGIAAVTFEQAITVDTKREIVALERVSTPIAPRQKTRVSVSILEVLDRVKSINSADQKSGNPILTVVAVEFMDGTLWTAP